MPYKDESMLTMTGGDASNDINTQLCFMPPEGPFGPDNQVTGTITAGDEDWIAIKLTEGNEYTINVGGDSEEGQLNDSVLKLMDGKGGLIAMNDDEDGAKGMLGSELKFTPEAGSGTQVYFISVSGFAGNPGAVNTGDYTVTVAEMALPEPGEGKTINGTTIMDDPTTPDTDEETDVVDDKLSGTDLNDVISGLGGNDSLYGLGGDDELNGGMGGDLLVGGPGADELNGGEGEDTIDYSYSAMGVTINLGDGTARGGDADGDTIGDDIENVRGSMHDDVLTGARVGTARHNKIWGLGGDDELDGLRGRDELYGGAGDDNLDGGEDDDILEGGYGADMLTGGDGMDTASYARSMMGVTVRLHNGQAMGGDAEGDMFAGYGTPVEYLNGDEETVEASVYDIEHLTGSSNDDILAGDLRDNTIMGGGGDDTIYGGPNPADADKESDAGLTNMDTLMGQGGDDRIFGGAGNDTLHGGDGDDMLHGGAGDDTFWGGHGSDLIYADATDMAIYGNRPDDPTTTADDEDESAEMMGDTDTVSYARLEEGVERTLGNDTGFILIGIENAIGSQGDDNITGDGGANVIEGGEGGDTLSGGTGAVADDGDDTLSYESSDDWVRITLAADGTAATASRGHASGDTATNFENVRGSAHDDDLTGNDGDNKLWGLAGDDDIDGAGGNDTIEGGAGADKLDGGYDSATAGEANTEANTVSYATSDSGVTVNLATSSVSGGHAIGDEIVTYEEAAGTDEDPNNEIDVATFANATGSMHNDHLTGNHHDNHLTGGAGDDTLRGGASSPGDRTQAEIRGDVLVGGPGADMLDGGEDRGEKDDMVPDPADEDPTDGTNMLRASVDWAVYKHAMEGVTVDLSTNRGTGGEAMGDTLTNIELVWGSEKDDTFIAGPGGDIIEGDGGSDTVSYEASEMGVTVNLGAAAQHTTVTTDVTTDPMMPMFPTDDDPVDVTDPATLLAGVPRLNAQDVELTGEGGANPENEDTNPNVNGAAGDRLRSIENLTGSEMKDDLDGDGNPNVLKGLGGNDELTGGAGNDTLDGGAGVDTLDGGTGDDKLNGGAGDDTLNGDAGEDTLTGGAGNDDLSGGTDNDTFVFSTADAGDSDAILDYTDGDMIDLSAFGLTAAQVIAATTLRGEGADAYVVINLEAHGGGRITIDDISSLDTLDTATDDTDTVGVDESSDGVIQMLDTDIFILG